MARKQVSDQDPEIAAMGIVFKALGGLPQHSQIRVLNYVADKLNVASPLGELGHERYSDRS